MMKIDVTGERYGTLVAVSRAPNDGRKTMWTFKCDCGNRWSFRLDHVRSGRSQSCGCVRAEVVRRRSTTHGHTVGYERSKTYRAWRHAKERCFNPNTERYPQYGGRGISMCDEWAANFAAFLRDMGECPKNKSLDRIEVNGDYKPGNCRWATDQEQRRNRTDNVQVKHGGKTMILKDYAAARGVNYKRLHKMVKVDGLSAKDAADRLDR